MRSAALTVALTACSSPAANPATTPPREAPAEVLAVKPLTAASPELVADPAPGCLPRGAEPWFGAGGMIVVCDFDLSPKTCFEVSPDGTATPVPEPPEPRHVDISGALVEICPGGGAECWFFDPKSSSDQPPSMADVDPALTRATVVRKAVGASTAVATLWDVTNEKELAHTTLTGGAYFYAWLLGRTILVGVGSYDATAYSLWKQDGNMLKRFAELDREPDGWVVLDDRTVAVRWLDGGVDILDARTGKISHPVAWRDLVADPRSVAGVFLAELGDRSFAVGPHDADRKLLGLGVGSADGTVTPYPVTFCP